MSSTPNLIELRQDYEQLRLINLRQEQRVAFHAKKAKYLTIFYGLFQSVIFLSVSHSSTIECHQWWVPFFLSLPIAIIYFITFIDTLNNYSGTRYHYELISLDLEHMRRRLLITDDQSHGIEAQGRPDNVKTIECKVYLHFLVYSMIALTIIVLVSCRLLLCDNDHLDLAVAYGTP